MSRIDIDATITVRRAVSTDGPALLGLICALAQYEHLPEPDDDARKRLLVDGFGPAPRFETYLAEVDGAPAGYAIVLETYSTFLARPTLYVEDLFVRPDARGQGAGRALFVHVAEVAKQRGCGRIEWTVLDWNELARKFYHRIGGQHLSDWLHYRMDEAGIAALADNTGNG